MEDETLAKVPWWPAPGGPARVIVPIVASTLQEALRQARDIATTDAELVEWRADCLQMALPSDTLAVIAKGLHDLVCPRPLIFTWRTADEGGRAASDEHYESVTRCAIDERAADLVDIQMRHPAAQSLIKAALAVGLPVVGSWHAIDAAPTRQEIVTALTDAEQAGVSVAKVAIMPQHATDVVALLSATAERSATARIPLLTMAMGSLGRASRVFGYVFGSQATFATVDGESAPGQPSLTSLRDTWASFE